MNGHKEEEHDFEIGVAVPKRKVLGGGGGDGAESCVEFLVNEFQKIGLIVERVAGVTDEFIKVLVSLPCVFISCPNLVNNLLLQHCMLTVV